MNLHSDLPDHPPGFISDGILRPRTIEDLHDMDDPHVHELAPDYYGRWHCDGSEFAWREYWEARCQFEQADYDICPDAFYAPGWPKPIGVLW